MDGPSLNILLLWSLIRLPLELSKNQQFSCAIFDFQHGPRIADTLYCKVTNVKRHVSWKCG
jgi:hypothetical protein